MLSLLALAALPLALAAPLMNSPSVPSIYGHYIVVLNNATGLQRRSEAFSNIHKTHVFDAPNFSGFSAKLSAQQVQTLKEHSSVAYVEQDAWLQTQDIRSARREAGPITQTNSTWGLGRISHKTPNHHEYLYDASAGEGTCSYILDSGILANHTEFEDRAMLLKNYDKIDNSDEDMLGHGTHVAGTIGSRSFGAAKKTKVIAIKVCNQYGLCMMTDIMAAMLEVIKDSKARAAEGSACKNGAVINLSLGYLNTEWRAIKMTVESATNAGVFVAIAAGNQFVDAKDYSPASAPTACTIGAIGKDDQMASFSNYGPFVSVFAPGVDVLSLSPMARDATAIMSGTSMATPHMAGMAAYMLGMSGPMDPLDLCAKIRDNAQKDLMKNLPTTAVTRNLIAYNGMEA